MNANDLVLFGYAALPPEDHQTRAEVVRVLEESREHEAHGALEVIRRLWPHAEGQR